MEQTIRGLQEATGFSRDAIKLRVERFKLATKFDPKDVLELKSLGEKQEATRQLEQERAELAHQQARKARVVADLAEGSVIALADARADFAELLDTIASTVKASGMAKKAQADLFTTIRKGGEAFEAKYGIT